MIDELLDDDCRLMMMIDVWTRDQRKEQPAAFGRQIPLLPLKDGRVL